MDSRNWPFEIRRLLRRIFCRQVAVNVPGQDRQLGNSKTWPKCFQRGTATIEAVSVIIVFTVLTFSLFSNREFVLRSMNRSTARASCTRHQYSVKSCSNDSLPHPSPKNVAQSRHVVSNQSRQQEKPNYFEPVVMIGILMMDTPRAAFQRKLLRRLLPPDFVSLRFAICQPTAETMLEPDVVSLDMKENINEGKTKLWFEYARQHMPPSVKAVFKMDTDVLFCLDSLLPVLQRFSRSKFAYYGTFMNHAACSTSNFGGCPPKHCDFNNTFVGDCWYYMSGGFYGFSSSLLGEVVKTSLFRGEWHEAMHEDIMSAMWVNNTGIRSQVVEARFDYHHSKQLVNIDPPTYANHFEQYARLLSSLNCSREKRAVLEQHHDLYDSLPWEGKRSFGE